MPTKVSKPLSAKQLRSLYGGRTRAEALRNLLQLLENQRALRPFQQPTQGTLGFLAIAENCNEEVSHE